MAKGEKPAIQLQANAKGREPGQRAVYLDIGVAWPSEYGGGRYNLRLSPGVKIRLADGTVVTNDSHWFSVTVWHERNGTAPPGKKAADDDWGDDLNLPPPPPPLPPPRYSAKIGGEEAPPHGDEDEPAPAPDSEPPPDDDIPF